MSRFSYLIPRTLILGLIAAALWMGSDPIIKRAFIQSSQEITGAKVEVGQLRASLRHGKIFLKKLMFADARDPLKNLVQADMAYVKLDPQQLLYRQFVIESGRSSQVQFGTPRTEPGSLNAGASDTPLAPASQAEDKTNTDALTNHRVVRPYSREEVAQKWLDRFQSTVRPPKRSQPRTMTMIAEARRGWESEIAKLDRRLADIEGQKNEIVGSLAGKGIQFNEDGFPINPLRFVKQIQEVGLVTNQLNDQINQMKQSIIQLDRQAAEDVSHLRSQARADLQQTAADPNLHKFDGDSLSQLLLANAQHQHVTNIVNWFRWFREAIPNPKDDFRQPIERGQRIVIPGMNDRPTFLIKSLQMDGSGHFAGRHLNFNGTAQNVTTEPWLHTEPMTLELRAQGNQHILMNCSLDRRSQQPFDRLTIHCPSLNVDSQALGTPETMVVTLGECQLQANVLLQLDGQNLSGKVSFHNEQVIMHVDELHSMAGGDDVALGINQKIAGINSFQTDVLIGGTLQSPTYSFESDLGEQLASCMNEVIRDGLRIKSTEQQELIRQQLDDEIRKLQDYMQENILRINRATDGETTAVADLQQTLKKFNPNSKIR